MGRKVQVWIHRKTKPGAGTTGRREILLLLLTPERGGFWQPVTGGVDEGESFGQAALREAREETGLEFRGEPRPLDYRFTFTGRSRGVAPGPEEFVEEVFELEAPEGQVRTDPREHVDHRWVGEAEAASATLASLKHASNAEGLRKLLRRIGAAATGLAMAFALHARPALAAQDGVVLSEGAEVHQFANVTSPRLGTLAKDQKVKLSSDLVRDHRGEYWYKVKLQSGEFGYVRGKDVQPLELERRLKEAGHQRVRDDSNDLPADLVTGWAFVVRAMGLGAFDAFDSTFGAGGEAEANVSVLPFAVGYPRRRLAAGLAFQAFPGEKAVLASIVYRFFSEGEIEPELRLRGGMGLDSGAVLAGFNIGVRYPFSLDSGPHLSGYLEAGGLTPFEYGPPIHVFGSAGVGFHF